MKKSFKILIIIMIAFLFNITNTKAAKEYVYEGDGIKLVLSDNNIVELKLDVIRDCIGNRFCHGSIDSNSYGQNVLYIMYTKYANKNSNDTMYDYYITPDEKANVSLNRGDGVRVNDYKIKLELSNKKTIINDGDLYSCGNGMINNIPSRFVKITSAIVNILKILIPVAIIIFGMIDLFKAIVSQKDDEIKKGQKVFFSRLIAGVIVFLVIFIVQMVVRFVSDKSESANIISCVDCFISGDCEEM